MSWVIVGMVVLMLLGVVTYFLGDPAFCAAFCAFACAGGMLYSIVCLTKIYREVHAVRLAMQKEQLQDQPSAATDTKKTD